MAYTSNLSNAEAVTDHKISLQANGIVSIKYLPHLPANHYLSNKGDLWKLHLADFFEFTTCITIYDVQRISILQGSNDAWSIESIVTFAVVDQSNWELTSADFKILQCIDENSDEAYEEFTLFLCTSKGQCIRYLFIIIIIIILYSKILRV